MCVYAGRSHARSVSVSATSQKTDWCDISWTNDGKKGTRDEKNKKIINKKINKPLFTKNFYTMSSVVPSNNVQF